MSVATKLFTPPCPPQPRPRPGLYELAIQRIAEQPCERSVSVLGCLGDPHLGYKPDGPQAETLCVYCYARDACGLYHNPGHQEPA